MSVLAVTFDFAGSPVEVSGAFLLLFAGLCLLLVLLPSYFNRSVNGEHDYIDQYWGDGSIDDDDWGLAVLEAKRATSRQLAELADRSAARAAGSRGAAG
jgi:hypothetical protein